MHTVWSASIVNCTESCCRGFDLLDESWKNVFEDDPEAFQSRATNLTVSTLRIAFEWFQLKMAAMKTSCIRSLTWAELNTALMNEWARVVVRARLFMFRSITSTISKHFTTNHTAAHHHLHHLRCLQILIGSDESLRSFVCHFSSEFHVARTSNRLLRHQDHQTPTNARHTVLTFEAQPCSTPSPSIP